MIKITPNALLVCGYISNSPPGCMTMLALKQVMGNRISQIQLCCLLDDMVKADMLWVDHTPGYAEEYYVKTFRAIIS